MSPDPEVPERRTGIVRGIPQGLRSHAKIRGGGGASGGEQDDVHAIPVADPDVDSKTVGDGDADGVEFRPGVPLESFEVPRFVSTPFHDLEIARCGEFKAAGAPRPHRTVGEGEEDADHRFGEASDLPERRVVLDVHEDPQVEESVLVDRETDLAILGGLDPVFAECAMGMRADPGLDLGGILPVIGEEVDRGAFG